MTVRYTPRALRQIESIGAYVARESPRAADALLVRIHASCRLLAEHSFAGHSSEIRGIRVLQMARDAYRIFYEVLPSGEARILHVRHTSRRPLRSRP
ncbi:MAG: type II toxin-antitoxin system RelE/ParE family toxin [Microvirga sp.]